MSQKKKLGILLWIAAVAVLVAGVVARMLGHLKTGDALFALAVIVIIIGLVAFFSRSSVKVEMPGSDWM